MASMAVLFQAIVLALAIARGVDASCCSGMTMNEAGLNLVKESEGFSDHVYDDSVGNPTVCWGHLVTPGESFPGTVSTSECNQLLQQDLGSAESCVQNNVNVPLNGNQFAALTDFSYNLGCGNLQRSTLLRDLNNGDYNAVPDQMKEWNHAGGRVLPGLTTRRNREGQLWNTPDASPTQNPSPNPTQPSAMPSVNPSGGPTPSAGTGGSSGGSGSNPSGSGSSGGKPTSGSGSGSASGKPTGGAGSTESSVGSTESSVGSTDASVGSTDATGGSTEATGGSTDATSGSTDATGGSTDATSGSTDATGGSTDATDASSAPSDASSAATGESTAATGASDATTGGAATDATNAPTSGADPTDDADPTGDSSGDSAEAAISPSSSGSTSGIPVYGVALIVVACVFVLAGVLIAAYVKAKRTESDPLAYNLMTEGNPADPAPLSA